MCVLKSKQVSCQNAEPSIAKSRTYMQIRVEHVCDIFQRSVNLGLHMREPTYHHTLSERVPFFGTRHFFNFFQVKLETFSPKYPIQEAWHEEYVSGKKVGSITECWNVASSMTFRLSYKLHLPFWKMADKVHRHISRRLKAENPFQLLIMELVHPTLVDSLYFQKLGFIDERLSRKMLKLAHWHKTYYGCAITNVGRLDIPLNYGHLKLEALYGPVVYSDVNEKTVGVTTVDDCLSMSMTCNGHQVSARDASRLIEVARGFLLDNIGTANGVDANER